MKKSVRKNKKSYKSIIIYIVIMCIGLASGSGIEALIRLSEKAVEVISILELADGSSVDFIDGGEISLALENSSDEEREEAVRGIGIDMTSPQTVVNSLSGQCIYLNNPYGSQCVNTTNIITQNMVGYYMSTCNTGAARGIWDCREYNARGGLELIYNVEDIRPGDLIVTYGGEYGHTGMATSYYQNGYISLFSTNQGGKPCEKGGSAANTIKLNMSTFSGAFRWHGWDYLFEEPEPEPTPIPITGCMLWHVKKGDTMSKIMLDCEDTVKYGEAMNNYAKSWYSLIYNKGKSVYDGWNTTGVGLFAGDDIEHRL